MERESIQVTRSVTIPRSEIELRFSRSSGPGGQHAQKSDTRVEATFDVEASLSLTAAQKRRVLARAGPIIRAIAQDERRARRHPVTRLELPAGGREQRTLRRIAAVRDRLVHEPPAAREQRADPSAGIHPLGRSSGASGHEEHRGSNQADD